MGRPNIALLGEETILTSFENIADPMLIRPLIVGMLVLLSALFTIRLLSSDFGLGFFNRSECTYAFCSRRKYLILYLLWSRTI